MMCSIKIWFYHASYQIWETAYILSFKYPHFFWHITYINVIESSKSLKTRWVFMFDRKVVGTVLVSLLLSIKFQNSFWFKNSFSIMTQSKWHTILLYILITPIVIQALHRTILTSEASFHPHSVLSTPFTSTIITTINAIDHIIESQYA